VTKSRNSIRKPVIFEGSSRADIQQFTEAAQDDLGYQLELVQRGEEPEDWKPMPTIGMGVNELRYHDDDGWFRVAYVAKFEDAVHVLHAFRKKTNKTSLQDIEIARKRFNKLLQKVKK